MVFDKKTYIKLLSFYLFTLVFFYPYGISIGSNSFRLSDMVTIMLIFIGLLLILKNKSIQKNTTKIWFILPFFILEVLLHTIGTIQFSGVSIMSSVRVIFLYLPLIFAIMLFTQENVERFNLSIEKVLKASLLFTFIYSLIQFGVLYGYLPRNMLLQDYIANFAVDSQYQITDGKRVSGFFNNGIDLSMFGMIGFCYFLSKLLFNYRKSNLIYLVFSMVLIVFSSTRVALIIMAALLVLNLFFSPTRFANKIKLLIYISLFLGVGYWVLNFYSVFDDLFYRISRLTAGLDNDFSFSYRVDYLWPNTIDAVKDMPLGTLVQPYYILGTIDSGYLSYYAQGKWLFILAMALFLIGLIIYSLSTYRISKLKWINLFIFNITVYISIVSITHNPMRKPLILFFVFYGLIILIYSNKHKINEIKSAA